MNGSLSTDVVRFGKFEVDLRARELRKGGARIRLQDQPFQILAMMLERPGELVTRDELQIRLWPDGTTVDFEHGVNAAVKRLRAALADDADHPRFIETLHRRGYRFIASIEGQPGAQKPRMAVLPFDNVSQDAGQDYFSDGLTSELIAQLGKVGANRLGVIARTSAMAYRATAKSASEIGRALSVQYLLEGSVRRDGDRVRIAAQLIETRGETQLWAQTYERDTADCLSVQADVASRIVQSLAFELFQGRPQVGAAGTTHPGAYQAYLKGRYQWNKPADEGLEPAITHFTEAIRLDPEFADAHASLARVYVGAAEYYARKPRAAFEAARSFAERALAIEPSNSDAHLALGDARRALDWDWKGAEEAYRAALAFNPSSEAAHRKYGVLLAGGGRNAEAAVATDRACDLDPLCLVVNTAAASVRYFARTYDDAIVRCRHTLDMDSGFIGAESGHSESWF